MIGLRTGRGRRRGGPGGRRLLAAHRRGSGRSAGRAGDDRHDRRTGHHRAGRSRTGPRDRLPATAASDTTTTTSPDTTTTEPAEPEPAPETPEPVVPELPERSGWSVQIGTEDADTTFGVSAAPGGDVVVAAATQGSLAGDNQGQRDVYLAQFHAERGTAVVAPDRRAEQRLAAGRVGRSRRVDIRRRLHRRRLRLDQPGISRRLAGPLRHRRQRAVAPAVRRSRLGSGLRRDRLRRRRLHHRLHRQHARPRHRPRRVRRLRRPLRRRGQPAVGPPRRHRRHRLGTGLGTGPRRRAVHDRLHRRRAQPAPMRATRTCSRCGSTSTAAWPGPPSSEPRPWTGPRR